ncbi:tetratricopeptide (TPR) repeat protein [Chitinivorax tropicus]|uniref:Tetratricopeptide (TPR) repeat protein n=1 Tax=Chitinivorax tropicus TaxID=714531 RepID=A0A840MT79_9PROT|nr:tetratricopeptide repeat protein [Chitinivorax tropicus]MBB5020289.1 tetratricopeptide (TPR) repeat protein [Chitinivorax tropicus]
MDALDVFDMEELMALAQRDLNSDRLDAALAKLKRVLAMEGPIPVMALSMVARLYAQLGLLERALDYFTQYLSHRPGALEETFQLGMVHYDLGQPREAGQYWQVVLEQAPAHPPALFYSALLASQAGDLSQANTWLDKLIANVAPDNLYVLRANELRDQVNHQVALLNQLGDEPTLPN